MLWRIIIYLLPSYSSEIDLVLKNWTRFLCLFLGNVSFPSLRNLTVESQSLFLRADSFAKGISRMYYTTGILCIYEKRKTGNFHSDAEDSDYKFQICFILWLTPLAFEC